MCASFLLRFQVERLKAHRHVSVALIVVQRLRSRLPVSVVTAAEHEHQNGDHQHRSACGNKSDRNEFLIEMNAVDPRQKFLFLISATFESSKS